MALTLALGVWALTPVTADAASTLKAPPRDTGVRTQAVAARVGQSGSDSKAADEIEITSSIGAAAGEERACAKNRRRLWVEGEGWIVRKVTTCY